MKRLGQFFHLFTRRSRVSTVAIAFLLFSSPCFASEPVPVEEVLQRVGKRVEDFLRRFYEVKCTELVSQAKLGKDGKVLHKEESVFDYLMMMQVVGDELKVEESRLAQREAEHTRNMPMLVTNGFSTLLLVFHPYYQGSFEFARLDDEEAEGKRWLRVRFQHIQGKRSPAVLLLRGREYPLELAGSAWIDSETGVIAKIHAGLKTGLEDVGLRSFRSEVRYAPYYPPVPFEEAAPQEYWLPALATIDVQTPRQHWRNIHRFTDYKQYSVSVKSSVPRQP